MSQYDEQLFAFHSRILSTHISTLVYCYSLKIKMLCMQDTQDEIKVSTSFINKWLMHVYAIKFHVIFLTDSKLLPQLEAFYHYFLHEKR